MSDAPQAGAPAKAPAPRATEIPKPQPEDVKRAESLVASYKKIKVEHTGTDSERWRDKYEEAVLGHGYTKKDCSKTQCVYVKGKARIRVNILELAKKWTTVIVEDYPEK